MFHSTKLTVKAKKRRTYFSFFVDRELVNTFDPNSRHFNRLEAIFIRVLKRICPNIFTSKSGECNGKSINIHIVADSLTE